MTDLSELLEHAKAATGPDRELDNDIYRWLHPEYAGFVEGRGGLVHPNDGEDQRVLSNVRSPNYTASIDASLALCERVLPGHQVNMHHYGMCAEASIGASLTATSVEAPTLLLAILAALLQALTKERTNVQ